MATRKDLPGRPTGKFNCYNRLPSAQSAVKTCPSSGRG
jgi:hypothetical protein